MPKHPRHGPPHAIPEPVRAASRESQGLFPTSLYPQSPPQKKQDTEGAAVAAYLSWLSRERERTSGRAGSVLRQVYRRLVGILPFRKGIVS